MASESEDLDSSAEESKLEATLDSSKELAELLKRIEENITRSLDKNDDLLEAIESSEARATQSGSNEVYSYYHPHTTESMVAKMCTAGSTVA